MTDGQVCTITILTYSVTLLLILGWPSLNVDKYMKISLKGLSQFFSQEYLICDIFANFIVLVLSVDDVRIKI